MLETAAHASNNVCLCDIRENEMWDPGASHFVRCRNGHRKRQDKEEETCKASFASSKLKHDIQDSFIGVKMTDERLRNIHYRLCNWLFHDHADSIKMKYFNIPKKMRKNSGAALLVRLLVRCLFTRLVFLIWHFAIAKVKLKTLCHTYVNIAMHLKELIKDFTKLPFKEILNSNVLS